MATHNATIGLGFPDLFVDLYLYLDKPKSVMFMEEDLGVSGTC